MAATDVPLFIEQGATFHLGFNWHRAGEVVDGVTQPGAPYDLTGCTLRMQIRRAQGQPPLLTATSEDPYESPGVLDPVKVEAGAGRIVLGRNVTPLVTPTLDPVTTAATGGLLADGTYFYVVTAIDASSETLESNEESVTAAGGGASVNTLTWTAVQDATGYRIYRGDASGAEVLLAEVPAATTYADDGSVTPGTATPPAEFDPGNGRIDITLTDEDTDMISAKTAVYDLEIEWPLRSGEIRPRVDRLLKGQVTVDPNVTQVDVQDPVVT
jgi:hypothetical protein